MLENLKNFSIAATLFACLFWAVALMIKTGKKKNSNYYVIALLSIATFVYIMMYAKFNELFWFYGNFFPLQALFTLLLFPLFYLYIHSLTKQSPVFKKVYIWHFVMPMFFTLLMFLVLHIWMDGNERYLFVSNHIFNEFIEGQKFKVGLIVYEVGKKFYVLSSILYTWLIFKNYKQHIKVSREIFPNDEETDLSWLRILFFAFIILVCFHLAIQLYNNAFVAKQDLLVIFSYLSFAAFFFTLGYFCFNQKQIYPPFTIDFEHDRVKSSKIKTEDIVSYFNNEKPFLNPEFSLYDLCNRFNTNRTYLSNQINSSFNMNFRSLINTYRLNEAKRLLKAEVEKNSYISMEYIALKAGFNSYSTFSRVFKQMEGIAPCDFKDQLSKTGN